MALEFVETTRESLKVEGVLDPVTCQQSSAAKLDCEVPGCG